MMRRCEENRCSQYKLIYNAQFFQIKLSTGSLPNRIVVGKLPASIDQKRKGFGANIGFR